MTDETQQNIAIFLICVVLGIGIMVGMVVVDTSTIPYETVIEHGCAEYDKTTGEFKLIDRSK